VIGGERREEKRKVNASQHQPELNSEAWIWGLKKKENQKCRAGRAGGVAVLIENDKAARSAPCPKRKRLTGRGSAPESILHMG